MKKKLEKNIECPYFKFWCVIPLIDKKICEGEKGNYMNCGCYRNYITQDSARDTFRALYSPSFDK